VKLPEKIQIFWKFAWKIEFFYADLRTPRFQTRLTPLNGTHAYKTLGLRKLIRIGRQQMKTGSKIF